MIEIDSTWPKLMSGFSVSASFKPMEGRQYGIAPKMSN